MDPRRRRATPRTSKAGAATLCASRQGATGASRAPTQPSELPAAPQPDAEKCSRARGSRSQQTKSAPTQPSEPPAAPQPDSGRRGGARGSRSQQTQGAQDPPQSPERAPSGRQRKAALRPEDAQPSSAPRAAGVRARAAPAEGPEPRAVPGPPPARAGSRRQGGGAATREPRPPPAPKEGSGRGAWEQTPSLSLSEAPPGGWKLRSVLEKLRLKRQEISAAAEVVNRVVGHLLRRLHNYESEFKGVALLPTGSYYERVKISAPNEFDVMFKLEVPRIQLEEYSNSGAHYFVKFKRNPKGNPLNQFLENDILSASKMLLKFRKIIKEEIKNIEDADVSMMKKKKGSPAVTLLIRRPEEISVDIILALESRSSWPASTWDGLPIQNWLGTKVRNKLRRQPFYLVPKHAKEGNSFQEETWRLSFSHIEKNLLNNHGKSKTCCETNGVKCCRKDCLKLMKFLLEQLKKKFENHKELNKFCSYHVKTAFFHLCTRDPLDSQWDLKGLPLHFDSCVTFFLECLRTEKLSHYFIPDVNLFSRDNIDKISKEFLLRQIEYERNNQFPVFDEF